MKKFVITLLVVLSAVCAVSSSALSSNNLSIEVRGYMAPSSSFYLVPRSMVSLDPQYTQGTQVPIATYTFTTNTVKDTQLTVAPTSGEIFSLVDLSQTFEYPYEIAICSYDNLGNIVNVNQAPTTNTVQIRSGSAETPSYGEIYACFPYTDEMNEDLLNTIESTSVLDNDMGGEYSSDLYFSLLVI